MPAPTVRVLDHTGADAGASPSITVEAGNPVIFGLAHRIYKDIRNATYRWVAASGTNTWKLELADGSPHGISIGANPVVYYQGFKCVAGSAADTLSELQFFIDGNNDVFVRVPSAFGDPDGLGAWGVALAWDNPDFSWGAGDLDTARRIWWTMPGGDTSEGTTCGFEAVSGGTLTCHVTNQDGDTGTRSITVTVNASTRVTKTAGVDGALGDLLSTHAADNNMEIVVPSGSHSTPARTLTGDNVVIRLEAGATMTVTGTINCNGENFTFKGPTSGTGTVSSSTTIFQCTATAASPATRHLFQDFTYQGALANVFQYDHFGASHAVVNVIAGDLGTTGIASYFMYDVNRGDSGKDARPFKLLRIHGCTNDYGNRDEVVVRLGGDLVTMTGCTWEQTSVSSTQRNKSAGVRIVGGDSWWIAQNTFQVPEATTGKGLNNAQGVGGVGWAPTGGSPWSSTHNGSWGTRGIVIERNRFIGTAVTVGGGYDSLGTRIEKVAVRRNLFDWAYDKHAEVFCIGAQSTLGSGVRIDGFRIVHNTFKFVQANGLRPINFSDSDGDIIDNLLVQNNLVIAPSGAQTNANTTGSAFIFVRSADNGTGQFAAAGLNGNVWAVLNDAGAGGDFPAACFGMLNGDPAQAGSSGYSTCVGVATANGYSYSTVDNTRENVSVDGNFRVTGSPTAKTQMAALSAGVVRDYHNVLYTGSGDAVGAVSNNLVDPGQSGTARVPRGAMEGGTFIRRAS